MSLKKFFVGITAIAAIIGAWAIHYYEFGWLGWVPYFVFLSSLIVAFLSNSKTAKLIVVWLSLIAFEFVIFLVGFGGCSAGCGIYLESILTGSMYLAPAVAVYINWRISRNSLMQNRDEKSKIAL